MVREKKKRQTALCGLILCTLLCGCGAGGAGETIVIGSSGAGERIESAEAGSAVGIDIGAAAGSEANRSVETVQGGKAAEAESREIRVHVCGAVVSPGVVSLPEDSRAEDALRAAGGFTEDAWPDYVNLAERVQDGEKLYFPTLDEKENMPVQETAGDGRVNINTADVAALCTLPGIGESRARDIIAYREANGAFESCEDIMKVSGIKDSVYSKISDRITVR